MNDAKSLTRSINSVLLTVVVAAILLVVAAYTNLTQKQIESYASYAVQQNTQGISREVDTYIDNALSKVQLASHMMAASMTDGRMGLVSEVLAPMVERSHFSFFEFILPDGTNVTELGEQFDASDRVYYQEGIKGNTGVWVNYHPKYYREYLLDFYTPVYNGNEIVGVLTGGIGADTDFLPLLTTTFFGEEVIGILCDENQKVISDTLDAEGEYDLDAVLRGFGMDDEGFEAFRTHIAEHDNTVFGFQGKRGRSIACLSVNEPTGWTVLQIVPAVAFQNVIRKTSATAYSAIGTIVAFLGLYLWYVIHTARKTRKQAAQESEQRIAEQMELSLTDRLTGFRNRRAYEDDLMAYPSVPTENDYVYISADVNGLKNVNDTLGHSAGDVLIRGAAECLEQCLGAYGRLYRIGGDEFVAMIFVDDSRLKFIEEDLTETISKWRGDTIQELSISWGCAPHREFPELTVRDLAQIADERMYQAKANYYSTKGIDHRHRQSAYSALCATYTKILKVDLTNDKYQIVLMDVHEQSKELGFSEQISTWLHDFGVSGLVHPDDVAPYLRYTEINYIRSHFRRDRRTLTVFYRRKIGGEFRQAMMEMIPTEDYRDDAQSIYLYVKGIDK